MTEPDEYRAVDGDAIVIRRLATTELRDGEIATIRALMDVAFGDDEEERFSDDDWAHATGGRHFVLHLDGVIAGHAAVVTRRVCIADRALRTGYVEAVAIEPVLHGRGLGSVLMEAVDGYIRADYELGALGTGRHAFYERLGWRTWQGPSSIRSADGERRTTDDDGYIMVLETPSTPTAAFDRTQPISCEWRQGDEW